MLFRVMTIRLGVFFFLDSFFIAHLDYINMYSTLVCMMWIGFFGTVGFEVSARELLKPVIETAENEKNGDIYVIVDKEEQILYSSDRKLGKLPVGSSYSMKEQASGEIFYQFPHVIRKIRNADCPPNFLVDFSRQKFRIYWTKIPDVDWLLLRHVPVR